VRSILVIRTAYVGDVMMAVPLLKPLRERFPETRITFLTASSSAPLLDGNPCVDEVITYDPFWFYPSSPKRAYLEFRRRMKERSFDLVIETRGDIREILLLVAPLKARQKVACAAGGGGWMLTDVVPYGGPIHRVEYHLNLARHLGAKVDGVDWGVYLTDEEKRSVDCTLRASGIRSRFVAVHPGSRVPLKRWPEERFAVLCDEIARVSGMPIVLVGTSAESPIVERVTKAMRETPVSLAGRLSLRELAGVLARASLFICNDSGPMHIAAAMKTPVVAIFGPSKSVETGPYGEPHRVVEKTFPCRFTCDENHCRNSEFHACMQSVTVDEVCRAAHELLG
jgi:ADP-heptose:LPS heptosyltransferase